MLVGDWVKRGVVRDKAFIETFGVQTSKTSTPVPRPAALRSASSSNAAASSSRVIEPVVVIDHDSDDSDDDDD